MNKNAVYTFPFVKDIAEGETYYCDAKMIVLMVDTKMCFINPFGPASKEYEPREDLTFPIKKTDGKITLLESKIRLTPYHSKENLKVDISNYLPVSLDNHVIDIAHSSKDIHGTELAYQHMSLEELCHYLSDWFDVMEGSMEHSPDEINDITKLEECIKKHIDNASKKELIDCYGSLNEISDNYDAHKFTKIVDPLIEDVREKLISLGMKEVDINKLLQNPQSDDWSKKSEDELKQYLTADGVSDDDFNSAKKELQQRQQKK